MAQGNRLERGAVEVAVAPITLPAPDREEEIDAGLISDARHLETVRPGRKPALATVLSLLSRVSAHNLPNRPITLVVGNAAGGIVDVTARLYAEAFSCNLGRTVVVENRPGVGGAAAR